MNARVSLNLPRDWQSLVEAAQGAGWSVAKTRGNHVKWVSPTGAVVFSASTPSDHRAIYNIRAQLRRHGLQI